MDMHGKMCLYHVAKYATYMAKETYIHQHAVPVMPVMDRHGRWRSSQHNDRSPVPASSTWPQPDATRSAECQKRPAVDEKETYYKEGKRPTISGLPAAARTRLTSCASHSCTRFPFLRVQRLGCGKRLFGGRESAVSGFQD